MTATDDTITLRKHWSALRDADRRFNDERDRRYSEVNIEREKALRIKEEADKQALDLARQIQTYKDEKANELREQISSERGLYATKEDLAALGDKLDLAIRPLAQYISLQQGSHQGTLDMRTVLFTIAGIGIALAGLYLGLRR